MRRADLSVDLILEKESEKDQSFFSKIIRSVSRSIERITEPKRVVYDIEKMNFSKHLTDELFPKYRKNRVLKTGFYSEYEINRIEGEKAEKLRYIDYLKSLKAREGAVNGNKEFITFLVQKRKQIEKNLNSFKNAYSFLKANERSLDLLQSAIEQRRIQTENLKFDKMKDFENRGRTLIKIKNIEVILQLVNKNDYNIPQDVVEKLMAYRAELISTLRTTIELRKRLDALRKQKVYEEEVNMLKTVLHNLSLKS